MKGADFPKYLSSFLSEYLPCQKNASTKTIASYRDTFKLFLIFSENEHGLKPERLRMSSINSELVTAYLTWLEKERNCSVSTRNQRLAAIHSFFRYVQKEYPENLHEIQRILSIPNKKGKKLMISYLTGLEMQILLSQPDCTTASGFRDAVLLSVLYDTAARVQEITEIQLKDIRLDNSAVITLHGKGDKLRQVPIMGKTKELLKKYLERKEYHAGISKGNNYLFVNQKKQQLSRWGISYILDKYVEMARKDVRFQVSFPVTPHVIRHYGKRYKMVSGDCKPAKAPTYPSIHSPFDHCLLSELRYSIRFLSSDQSGSSLVGRMSIYAASSAFRRVSVSALA
jgi:site-specific recombinase XerD